MELQVESVPTISVVMCTYNGSRFIRKSIESILNQSYIDFEFIIWDDGSSDDTAEIIKSYNDKRIRYFFHSNTGLGQALHFACEQARGKYIARIDDDDICEPHRLKSEVEYMEKNKDCVLVSAAVHYINEAGEILGRSFPYTWSAVLKAALKFNSPFVHPACMYRRDAYIKTSGYPDITFGEDMMVFRELSKQGKVHNIGTPLLQYRLLPRSASHGLERYMSLIRSALNLISDRESPFLESDEKLYREIVKVAKQDSINQDNLFQIDIWNKCYIKLKRIFPAILSERIVLTAHNLCGIKMII